MVAKIMKTNLFKFIRPHKHSCACLSAVLGLGLFVSLLPHHMNSANARQPHYKANIQMPDRFYSSPRSPASCNSRRGSATLLPEGRDPTEG
jgi:hypothetical protein